MTGPTNTPRRRAAALAAAGLALALAGSAFPTAAGARSLHWPELAVTARLDAAGRLHVVERQTMVFEGDWNGGERGFDLRPGQDLELHRLARVGADGVPVLLREGDLDAVDRYGWQGDRLRWRSRLPTDPPFAGEALTYVLDYTLSGVLARQGDRYRLRHDFAFAERPGTIERFVLDLELDPAWEALDPLPRHLERGELPPGRSVVLTARLEHVGAGRPAAALGPLPFALVAAAFAAAFAAMVWLFLGFHRYESRRGRYDRPRLPPGLDPAWLEENLFTLLPEEAGALWDRRVGPPEVAAVLARLVAEGKLASSVREGDGGGRRQVLTLRLLADRETFSGHERRLVDKLFFDGRAETDTEAVRRRYEKRGFNPAAEIRSGVEAGLARHLGEKPPGPPARPLLSLLALVALALAVQGVAQGLAGAPTTTGELVGYLAVMSVLPLCFGLALAFLYRLSRRGLGPLSVALALPGLAVLVAAFAAAVLPGAGIGAPVLYPGPFGLLAMAAWPVALHALLLWIARTRESRQAVRKRSEMAEIRRRFAAELARPQPALDDRWYPYLVAFGLDRQLERWFESYGGAAGGATHLPSTITTASSSPSSPAWTGGGGRFGGAGASAGWTAAAAGLAAGVAAPGSAGGGGGSGGGGGGGGSSSGGGSGGGW